IFLIVALIGVGSLMSNVPAALVTARFGERRALVGAAVFSVFALLLCIFAVHVWMLAAGILMMGMGASVFTLARQSYLMEAVPLSMRARAMSTLAGSMRIGVFVGPFAGAALIHLVGLSGAYWVALLAVAAAGAAALALPELEPRAPGAAPAARPSLISTARSHARIYLTVGVGVLLVGALRASRQVVIPMWADHLGLDPAAASIVYGLSAAIDMAVFYPAGKVMDQQGRIWVALPATILMGIALFAMPFTSSLTTFLLASLCMGLGNGIGSGIVMTLGADAAPREGRHQFLGIWRMMSDIGTCGGPIVLAAVTAMFSLAMGIGAIGAMGITAAAIFWRWLPPSPPSHRQQTAQAVAPAKRQP
ncbi:MAG: MFS transporter, partial [Comamonadaceae bacterium]